MKKTILSSILALSMVTSIGVSVLATENVDNNTQSEITMEEPSKERAKDTKPQTIPGGKGTIRSNVWRGTSRSSGNTYQWDYQVSAEYTGNYAVEYIMTEWRNSASLRTSASISGGASADSVSAGGSSAWQSVKTPVKYWKNTNGSKNSSWRSTIVVNPKKDYRSGTVSTVNTARVKLKSDAKPYEAVASV